MPFKDHVIGGFGGGLVTAVDESVLDPKMSPDLLNVEVGDSESIRRRLGYVEVCGTVTTAEDKTIHAFRRVYWGNNSNGWFVLCGTNVFYREDVANEGSGVKELGASGSSLYGGGGSNVSGTNTNIYLPVLSNGQGVEGHVTLSATVPVSNKLTVNLYNVTGSIKLDGGSYVSLSASNKVVYNTTSSTHTIYVKPKSPNGKSMKASTSTDIGASCLVTKNGGITLSNGEYIEVYFYDFYPNATLNSGTVEIKLYQGSASNSAKVTWGEGSTYYFVTTELGDTSTACARSNGWHVAKFLRYGNYIKVYIDNTLYHTGLATSTVNGVGAWLQHTAGNAIATSVYIDQIIKNGGVVEDFDNVSGWQATGSIVATSEQYVATNFPIILDNIEWSNTSSLTNYHSISATGNNFAIDFIDNKVYYSTDYDKVHSFNGTSASIVSGSDMSGFLAVALNRLFTGGPYTHEAKLQVSAPGEPENFNTANDAATFLLSATGSDEFMTGMKAYGSNIYVFSYSSTYRLNIKLAATTGQWEAEPISTSLGCIAPKSLADGDKGLVFLSSDGVRGYGSLQSIFANDGTGFSLLSKNIRGLNVVLPDDRTTTQPWIDGYTDSQRAAAIGKVYRDKYWLFIRGASDTDVYVFDLGRTTVNKQPVVSRFRYGISDTITCAYVGRGDEYGLYVGTNAGKIYQIDTGNYDDGAAINFYYKTPPLSIGPFESLKHIRKTYVAGAPYNNFDGLYDITLGVSTVKGGAATNYYVQLAASTDTNPVRVLTSHRGKYIQYTLSGTHSGEPVEISRLTTIYTEPRETL